MSSRTTRRTTKGSSTTKSTAADPIVAPLKMTTRQKSSAIVEKNLNRTEIDEGNMLSQYSQLIEDRDSNMVLYFVLPSGQSEATCVPNLASAFLLCQDYNLTCEWLEEKHCLKNTPKTGNIFVLAPFEGPLFDYLKNHRIKIPFEIIGPQCIKYAIQCKEPNFTIQNQGYPAYTLGMRNILVTLSGLADTEKKSLTKKIRLMSGNVSASFTLGVTHVVADTLLTDKCTVAYQKGIPVMTKDWVEAVWKDSQEELVHATDPRYVKYACPTFHNLIICVSQVTSNIKTALKNAIEANGGKYAADLVRNKTSILVVPTAGGNKYHYAKTWKLPCVSPDWVEASKSAGHILPVKGFAVIDAKMSTPQNSMVQPPPANILDSVNHSVLSSCGQLISRNALEGTYGANDSEELTSAPTLDLDLLRKAAAKGPYLDGCTIYVCGIQNSDIFRKHLNSTGATRLNKLNETVTHILVTEKRIPTAELELLNQLENSPYIVTVEWLVASAQKGSPADEEMYIFIPSNNSSKNSNKSVSIVHATISELVEKKTSELNSMNKSKSSSSSKRGTSGGGGGLCAFEIPEGTTTTTKKSSIKGNRSLSPHQKPGLSPHQQPGLSPPKADCSIIAGNDQFEVVENDPAPNMDVSTNSRTRQRISNDDVNVDPSPLEQMSPPQGAHQVDQVEQNVSQTKSDTQQSEENIDDDATPDDFSEPVYPFTDKKVKIELGNAEDMMEIASLVQEANGEIVSGLDFDLIILPPICEINHIKNYRSKCFTKYWVIDCIDSNTCGINISFHHKPLADFEGILNVMPDVVVAVSQYSNTEKDFITSLVTALGGKAQDVFARKSSKTIKTFRTTHLICPSTNNQKFMAARKWGTPVVIAEWVLDSHKCKRIKPVDPYNPELRSDSDSQSQASCIMPKTPQQINQQKGSSKLNKNGAGISTMSNFPSSTQKPHSSKQRIVSNQDNESPFKLPGTAAKKNRAPLTNHRDDISFGYNHDSFIAWKAAGGSVPADLLEKCETESFLEWQAAKKAANGNGDTSAIDTSFVINGMTKAETRMIIDGLDMMGCNSPAPRGIPLKRRNSTPKSVMMARTWKELMEKFPVGSPKSTSTPKTHIPLSVRKASSRSSLKSGRSSSDSSNSSRADGNEDGISIPIQISLKRSSDSSIEDDIVSNGGALLPKKRLRISSDSDEANISEILQENEHHSKENEHHSNEDGNSSNKTSEYSPNENSDENSDENPHQSEEPRVLQNLVAWIAENCNKKYSLGLDLETLGCKLVDDLNDASLTHFIIEKETPDICAALKSQPNLKVVKPSWIFACKSTNTHVDEEDHKAIARSKASMQALADLLANDDGMTSEGAQYLHKPKKVYDNRNSRMNPEDPHHDKLKDDEYDAPHVVWDEHGDAGKVTSNIVKESPLETIIGDMGEKENKIIGQTDQPRSSRRILKASSTRTSTNSKPGNHTPSSSTTCIQGSTTNFQRAGLFVEMPRNPIFMLSGLDDKAKAEVSEIIERLGGRVLNSNTFDSSTFGIISSALARSEKVLGSIAAGKCLIKLSYIFACQEIGKFLPITNEYIWREVDGKDKMEQEIADAGYYWYTTKLQNPLAQPMHDKRIYIIETNGSKRAAYSRLIQAGGGTIASVPEEATLIIADKKQLELVPKNLNVPIEAPLILNTIILYGHK